MFSIKRLYNGKAITVPLLYVDELRTPYTFDNLQVQATAATDTLYLRGVEAVCQFAGYLFPLSGANFLTVTTGTLTIEVTQELETGQHVFPFVTTVTNSPLSAFAPLLSAQPATIPLLTAVSIQVQSLYIPGVTGATRRRLPTARLV